MRIFATQLMEEIKGRQQTFEKLMVDGTCYYDQFEDEIKKSTPYHKELKTVLSYVQLYADGTNLPISKFRQLHTKLKGTFLVEFKSKHLRLYACSVKGGKLVITGGFKNDQDKNIEWTEHLVREYLKSCQK
jgi:hypothetical protein